MSDNEGDCNEIYNDDYYMYDENDLGNNIAPSINDIDFLEESEIIKEREKIIEEAIEKLFLERDDAILAMIYLEWQENKIESWYDNVDENKFKAGIELSPKTKNKPESELYFYAATIVAISLNNNRFKFNLKKNQSYVFRFI